MSANKLRDEIFETLTQLVEQTGGTLGYGRFRKEALNQILEAVKSSLPKKAQERQKHEPFYEYYRGYNAALSEVKKLLEGEDV